MRRRSSGVPAGVEWAFRDSKSVHLEMRPVYLRAENRTRGHAVVVMLAYLMAQELRRRWRDSDLTVREGLHRLAGLCVTEVRIGGRTFLSSGSDAARRHPPIVRSRQHRHPDRAAAGPRPSSHQEETPTTPKSEINSTRYPRAVLTEEGEHPLQQKGRLERRPVFHNSSKICRLNYRRLSSPRP